MTNGATVRSTGSCVSILKKEGKAIPSVLAHFPLIAEQPAAVHYLERLTRRGRSGRTLYNYGHAISHFLAWCKENDVSFEHAKPWQVEEYFATSPYSPGTQKTHLVQIKAVYRYGQQRGLIESNPTYDVELAPVAVVRPHILSSQELRDFRDLALSDRHWLLFHILAYTGARRDEIRRMVWKDVDARNNTIYVNGKGAKERLIPIHPALGEIMVEHNPGKMRDEWALVPGPYGAPMSLSGFEKVFKSFITTATFHDFRRTVASSLDANGVQEGVIMKIMGWAARTIFDKHYRHVADERLQAAIIHLYANDPISA